MGITVTNEYKKGCEIVEVTTLIPSSPIMNAYLHFANDPRKAPTTINSKIIIENTTIDETNMAITGKQFASADIVCCDDGSTTLMIPPVEYNLIGNCSLTADEMAVDCTSYDTEADLLKEAKKKEIRLQTGMYKGVLNRTAQIGMTILRTGMLEAHNSSFSFGTDHIYAATASEKYADDAFDVMDFISIKLEGGVYDKVTISGADIRAFKGAIKACGDNTCTTKGFIPASPSDKGGSIVEKGVVLIGYHEDTNTPIYAVSAKATEKVRDEVTGKVVKTQVDLLPSGMMIFTEGKVIDHRFGALQGQRGGTSLPVKGRFRQFQEADKGTNLISTRLQTKLTPFVASFENVLVVDGLV